MSKRLKNLIESELKTDFGPLEGIAVINPRGIGGNKSNAMRKKLHAKGLKMTVVKNTLARRAAADSKITGFEKLLDGPSAVIFGQSSMAEVARLLLAEKKEDDKLELRGIFFDGDVYEGQKGVETVSKLPTREEAIANVVSMMLAPGAALAGIFKGQAGKVAALVKAVEEKRRAAGETEEAATPAAPAADAAPEAPAAS